MGSPFRRRLHVLKGGTSSSRNAPGDAPAASADEEDWPAIDTPRTEPSYLRAERDDAWSLAVSWRGVLVAALLFGCLALLSAYFH
jgi:hypothetical protein